MFEYIVRRLFMIIPTLFGITVVVFAIVNLAPVSPIEQKIQALQFSGAQNTGATNINSAADQGVSEEVVEALKKQYGFDKPVHQRYLIWLRNIWIRFMLPNHLTTPPKTKSILKYFYHSWGHYLVKLNSN